MRRTASILTLGAVCALASSGEPQLASRDTRDELRRTIGDLEARAADTRTYARERVVLRGEQLEAFRKSMNEEQIPALQRDLDALRAAVVALRDDAPRLADHGVEILIDSCRLKSRSWSGADKYEFRAQVRVDPDITVRSMTIRDPADGDLDLVRIPPSEARDGARGGVDYEIYDSFKVHGDEAELVVEEATGREHANRFRCEAR